MSKTKSRYSYEECLRNAYKVNWRIEDVLGGQEFDPSRHWLPDSLSGAREISCLNEDEKRRLTHVEMAAYAHLFGYVEEFIAPKVTKLALDFEIDNRSTYDALTNFAAEEVKHMNMFRQLRAMADGALGFPCKLLGGQKETAHYVLSKSTQAVLLLTACIEWFTQRHYVEAIECDSDLDPLTKHVFKCHWVEECQHAKMDHLETLRSFEGISDAGREKAVDELIELVGAVDGLLQQQAEYDVENLATYLGRSFSGVERSEIYDSVLRAKRYTFIETGVTHPRFQELFVEVTTPAQQEKVAAVLGELLAEAGAAV